MTAGPVSVQASEQASGQASGQAEAEGLPLSGPAVLGLMQAVLARGMPFRFSARGWSMAPFIQDGDVITVSPLLPLRPRMGDVVAFIRPANGRLVVHRVVGRREAAVLVQGDNGQDETDGFILPSHLLGRVTKVERGGRSRRLGLGPERTLIAWLSRLRLLVPLGAWLSNLLRLFGRRRE